MKGNMISFNLCFLSAVLELVCGDQCSRCDRLHGDHGTLEYSWKTDDHCWWFPSNFSNLNEYALVVKVNSISLMAGTDCNGKVILPGGQEEGNCQYSPGNCVIYTKCANFAAVKSRIRAQGCNRVYLFREDDFQCQKITLTTRHKVPKSFSMTYTYFKCLGGMPVFTTSTTTPTATTTTTTKTTTPRSTTMTTATRTSPASATASTTTTPGTRTTTGGVNNDILRNMGRSNNRTTPECTADDGSTVPAYFLDIVIGEGVLLGIAIMMIILIYSKNRKLKRNFLKDGLLMDNVGAVTSTQNRGPI